MRDLPPNVGCLLLRLSEQTKTNRSSSADVPLAYATRSGYHPGKWYERLLRARYGGPSSGGDPSLIFVHEHGAPWDSHFFRSQFVYPLLCKLKVEGDAALHGLSFQGPISIPEKYKSLHMYRRGGRTHCELVRAPSFGRRKASPTEIYEHGRWRRQRSSMPAPLMYRAWSLWDRLQLTLFCM
jgi:hypothetical protein